MIAITAASGQLGRLVIENLLKRAPGSAPVAIVRNPAKIADFVARGVAVREADYNDDAALAKALVGVEKLLLISSSEVGRRAVQHANVIEAAKRAGVKLVVYTSLLRADSSTLCLAPEHVETEKLLRASGLPFVILRNGWYSENYTASIPAALSHGVVLGSTADGRIASAARADYAEAAVAALSGAASPGSVIELAGDSAYTLAEFAAELSRQTGRAIPYNDLPEAEYRAVLEQAGLPAAFAALLADSDAQAAKGALFDDGRALSRLIGRPTTPLAETIRAALKS